MLRTSGRLFSLDCLRGLDMLLLTVITPIVVAADSSWGLPAPVMKHCVHAWGVLSLHDLIMPCFIFMCGAAIPFALGKRLENGRPTPAFWRHIAARFCLLYFLGSIAQCGLLSFKPMEIFVFYNTLQVIAVAYVATALAMLIPSRRVQVALPVALAATMGLVVHFAGGGDYSPTGNFAYRFDRIVWGAILPDGQCTIRPEVLWCYLLPQLACIAITMCGYECALILRSARREWVKAGVLFSLAAALFAAAAIVSVWVPVIKHIYSISFSLYATAWSVLALAVLYVVTDIWKLRRGTWLLLLFGQNALAAYMLRQMFSRAFATGAKFFTVGVPEVFGAKAQAFADGVVAAVLLSLTLFGWAVYKDWRSCLQHAVPSHVPDKKNRPGSEA